MSLMAKSDNPVPSTRFPPQRSRMWRALSFLAIVWTIAGAFWTLFQGQMWLFHRIVRSDLVPDWMTASTRTPADCSAVVADVSAVGLDAASLKRARWAAWELGFGLGAATALRNTGQPDTEQNRQVRSDFSSELGVPTPELPPLQSLSYALSEFREQIAADPQCIGALLAKFYSPRHDALYRFGALVGHVAVYRIKLPELDPLFVPDLRRYGRASGLPVSVFDPFTDSKVDVRKALAGVNASLQAEPLSQE